MSINKKEQTAVMTGATSGFGKVIAKHIIQKNYHFLFLARSSEKAEQLKASLLKEQPHAKIDFILCDLSSFQSINGTCQAIHEKCAKIDLLVLNAGLWNFEYLESKDGIEETLHVNLLAPALLLLNLKDLIPTNKASKVIFTASALHQGTIQFDDIEFKTNFSGFKAYRQSKLGMILLTRLWSQSPEFSDISLYSVHPGVVKTELGKNANWFSRAIFRLMGSSIEKGARTHLHLIDTPAKQLVSGEYYAKSKITKASEASYDMAEAKKLLTVINDYLKPYPN